MSHSWAPIPVIPDLALHENVYPLLRRAVGDAEAVVGSVR